MSAFAAKHLIYPIHERLLKRKTFRYLRAMEASQWHAPTDILELQRTKLLALLRHARAVSPFYRARLGDESEGISSDNPTADAPSFDPGAGRGTDRIPGPSPGQSVHRPCYTKMRHSSLGEILESLPLLSKSEIQQSIEHMKWQDAPGGLTCQSTGGSTGNPLAFYVDRRRQGYDQAARLRSHRWFGVEVGERELYLWGSPIEWTQTDRLKRLRDRLFNHRLLNAFAMSPAQMDQYLDEWDRFRPVSLYGYPSSIALLIEHARTRNRTLDSRLLKAVFVTGEVCFPQQRQTISEFFGVPVANGYGSREAGFIAHECPVGNMHICAENVIVEIIDADGRRIPNGESGEIVVTHLDAFGMPMIRYRTGDLGRLRNGRCACGRGLPMMDVVSGRTTDFIVLPDGTVKHALSIIYPLRGMSGVRQFRVVQDQNHAVSVQVVADDRRMRITLEAVAQRIRPVIGDEVGLKVELVDHIQCPESGKHRYVVSHAPQPNSNVRAGDTADA